MTEPLKALSLWQPWGSLWLSPNKRHETRDWKTSHRGRLLVHAAKRFEIDVHEELVNILDREFGNLWPRDLPTGAIIGMVDLVDVIPTSLTEEDITDRVCGDFGPDRFGWRAAAPTGVFRSLSLIAAGRCCLTCRAMWSLRRSRRLWRWAMGKAATRQLLIEQIAAIQRKPGEARYITPAEVVSAALSLFVPGPASVISPTGLGTRLILLTLRKMNFKVVSVDPELAEFRRDRYGHNHSTAGGYSWSRITYLAHAKGHVMCRRPGYSPFVITEKQWLEFSFYG